jgi:hypothetical protein
MTSFPELVKVVAPRPVQLAPSEDVAIVFPEISGVEYTSALKDEGFILIHVFPLLLEYA